jgi:hypothetical protein
VYYQPHIMMTRKRLLQYGAVISSLLLLLAGGWFFSNNREQASGELVWAVRTGNGWVMPACGSSDPSGSFGSDPSSYGAADVGHQETQSAGGWGNDVGSDVGSQGSDPSNYGAYDPGHQEVQSAGGWSAGGISNYGETRSEIDARVDTFWGHVASFLGIKEEPAYDPVAGSWYAQSYMEVSALGVMGTIAGFAVGFPGIGIVGNYISDMLGMPSTQVAVGGPPSAENPSQTGTPTDSGSSGTVDNGGGENNGGGQTGTPSQLSISLSATAEAVEYGGSVTILWSATKASSCEGYGAVQWNGPKNTTTGSQTLTNLTSSTVVSMRCLSASGDYRTKSVFVTVVGSAPTSGSSGASGVPAQPAGQTDTGGSPTNTGGQSGTAYPSITSVTFIPPQAVVEYGGNMTLMWSAENAISCIASGDWPRPQSAFPDDVLYKSPVGSLGLTYITQDKVLVLTCKDANGATKTGSMQIMVVPPSTEGGQ